MTLVEKAMGYEASVVGIAIARIIGAYVAAHRLGIVSGADGMFQLRSSVRGPDVAYVSRERLPNQKFPTESYPALEPNLVVEVLSPGNTKGEMTRKRLEYFHSNVQVVWIIDCLNRSVAAYTSPSKVRVYSEEETIDGGDAIPGFTANVSDFFRDLDIGLDLA
jgi:Uma2 family endonuclease